MRTDTTCASQSLSYKVRAIPNAIVAGELCVKDIVGSLWLWAYLPIDLAGTSECCSPPLDRSPAEPIVHIKRGLLDVEALLLCLPPILHGAKEKKSSFAEHCSGHWRLLYHQCRSSWD